MFAKVKPNTRIIGQNIIYFNQIDSSNAIALELMKQNLAGDGTVILAEFQGKGRGQGNKHWISDAFENLLFSVVLLPVTKSDPDPFILNKAIALSIYETIQALLPDASVKIKWPNDILINTRKVCGILLENNYSARKLNWCIAGVGINVNQDFDSEAGLNATSLKRWQGSEVPRETLLQTLLERMDKHYLDLLSGKQSGIQKAIDEALFGYDVSGEFTQEGHTFHAILRGCDGDGRLLLETEDGKVSPWLHGQIKQLIYE